MAAVECTKCGADMVAVTKKAQVSAGGIVGGLLFVLGLFLLLVSAPLGLGAIVVGIIVGVAARPSSLRLQCPRCGARQ